MLPEPIVLPEERPDDALLLRREEADLPLLPLERPTEARSLYLPLPMERPLAPPREA